MPVSSSARRAWTWGGGLVAAALLAWSGANAVSLVAHEAETVVTRVGGPGIQTVEVRSPGAVRVTSGARSAIAVTAHLVHGLRGPDHGHRLEGRRLVVWADCPAVLDGRCSADFTLKVPQGLNVVAHAEHGDIEVTDTFGSVAAVSQHGDVRAVNVVGPVHLETEHGEVTGEGLDARSVRGTSEHGDVRLSMSGVPRDLVAETEHGDVEVTVPDLVTYRVDADTEHGTTQTDVRIDPRSPRSIAARSEHGDVVVRNGGVVVVPPAPPAP